jgi:hypothetical protein
MDNAAGGELPPVFKRQIMITIFKYQFLIADQVIISMPEGAKVLSVQVQNNTPTIWAMVVTESKPQNRQFRVYGTGNELDTFAINGKHLGTIQQNGFVWHIFE